MLPGSNDEPALIGQQEVCLHVPLPVRADLLCPEASVRFRHSVMLRAPMPEASVQEDSDLDPREDQIGRSSDLL
jgi:hypothetical protein